jgi:hypothetical protein
MAFGKTGEIVRILLKTGFYKVRQKELRRKREDL